MPLCFGSLNLLILMVYPYEKSNLRATIEKNFELIERLFQRFPNDYNLYLLWRPQIFAFWFEALRQFDNPFWCRYIHLTEMNGTLYFFNYSSIIHSFDLKFIPWTYPCSLNIRWKFPSLRKRIDWTTYRNVSRIHVCLQRALVIFLSSMSLIFNTQIGFSRFFQVFCEEKDHECLNLLM